MIKDRASRSFRERVTVAELLSEGDRYDPVAYVELLARGADTLLAPLGFPYPTLCERWHVGHPIVRPGPRSPEQRAQRTL